MQLQMNNFPSFILLLFFVMITSLGFTQEDINMEKLMKMHNQKTPDSKKILEINAKHPMIVKISQNLSNFDHKKISQIILDQANILDGNVLSNPSNYMESLTELFIK